MKLEEMRERKAELGLTNEMIAEKSGVPLGTVQKVLSGITKHPRRKTLEALAAVLEIKEQLPYAVGPDGFITERPDYWDPEKKAFFLREAAAEYGRKRVYTIEDIRALPEGVHAELIDGRLYIKATPNREHQKIAGGMHLEVAAFIRKQKKKCEVFIPPYAVYLNQDDKTYLEPDLTVVCDSEKDTFDGCFGAPDWVVEVVSPSSKKMDYSIKFFRYRQAGVKLYWIIDPIKKVVMTCWFADPEGESIEIHSFDEKIPCALCPELVICPEELL